MSIAVLLLALLVGVGDVCPDCQTVSGHARLCPPHAEELDRVIGRCIPRLAATVTVEVRMEALAELAGINRRHANAPAKVATLALGRGLSDPAWVVRSRTAELLSEDQHVQTALDLLTDGVDSWIERQRGIPAQARKLVRLTSDIDKDKDLLTPTLLGFQAVYEAARGVAADCESLARALARLPDDRSVNQLGRMLKELKMVGKAPGPPRLFGGVRSAVPIVDALAGFGTRQALSRIVEVLKWTDAMSDDASRALAEAHKQKPPPTPAFLAGIEEAIADLERLKVDIRAILIRMAEEGGLDPPPEEAQPIGSWLRWLQRNEERLPWSLSAQSKEKNAQRQDG